MLIAGFDLETTGLPDPAHRIIECAVIRYEWDGSNLTRLDDKVWRIDPQRSIDAKARAVHKITEADLIGKPTFDKVAKEIADYLDTVEVGVAHNAEFDCGFLEQEFNRVGCPLPDFTPYDTMENGRSFTPMGEAPSLQALCFAAGVEYDTSLAHAALYDVDVMMKCFEYGLKRKAFTLPI